MPWLVTIFNTFFLIYLYIYILLIHIFIINKYITDNVVNIIYIKQEHQRENILKIKSLKTE